MSKRFQFESINDSIKQNMKDSPGQAFLIEAAAKAP